MPRSSPTSNACKRRRRACLLLGALLSLAGVEGATAMAEEPAKSLEERIDRAESRTAIADLVHAYARHIRYDEPDQVAALFTPDGWFEIRDGHPDRPDYTVRERLGSPAQIDAHLAPNKGKPHPIPLIHNLTVTVDGDTGTANSVMEAQIYGSAHKVIGEYRDTFRRIDGRWYFASRTYTIFKGGSSL